MKKLVLILLIKVVTSTIFVKKIKCKLIKPCPIDLHLLHSKKVKSSQTGESFVIRGNFNCFTEGVIYVTTCDICKKQYIGQTGRSLHTRKRENMYDLKKGKMWVEFITVWKVIITRTWKCKLLRKLHLTRTITD